MKLEWNVSPEEVSRQLQILASDNYNLCAAQNLLSDDGGKTSQKMSAAVNDDSLQTKKELH